MPDNEKSDIDYQPKAQGYSYSSKNNASNNNKVYLLIGVVLLIIVVLSSILYLNNSAKKDTVINPKAETNTSLTNDPKFTNYKKLTNQASDSQIKNYLNIINEKNLPLDDSNYPNEIYGIYSGFDKNNIQIITYNGIKNLPYGNNLIIAKQGKVEKSATSSAVNIGFLEVDKNSFFSLNMFGKILHLSVTNTSSNTIEQIYLLE